MTLRTQRRHIDGPAGRIEVALDWPAQETTLALRAQEFPLGAARRAHAPVGLAFIGHPHPLYGGSLDNKVAATLARAFAGAGWLALRPNFRGVGASTGEHDHGIGETEDLVHLIESAPRRLSEFDLADDLPFALAGFSFGSFVVARAAQQLAAAGRPPSHLVLVGAAAGKWDMPPVPSHTLVIHGESDETIPLTDVFRWAGPLDLPVVVLPGADHFFHRRLPTLKRLVQAHLCTKQSIDGSGASD